jgi:hypothetical protein
MLIISIVKLPNISLINLADSPIYLSTIAEETTFKKLHSSVDATALAKSVFPVPGGPYNNTPFGGFIPTLKKSSGLSRGNSITYNNIIKVPLLIL